MDQTKTKDHGPLHGMWVWQVAVNKEAWKKQTILKMAIRVTTICMSHTSVPSLYTKFVHPLLYESKFVYQVKPVVELYMVN